MYHLLQQPLFQTPYSCLSATTLPATNLSTFALSAPILKNPITHLLDRLRPLKPAVDILALAAVDHALHFGRYMVGEVAKIALKHAYYLKKHCVFINFISALLSVLHQYLLHHAIRQGISEIRIHDCSHSRKPLMQRNSF